jgi:hypothetical protein
MSKQLHKNFVDEQVKLLLKSYVDKGYSYIKEILEKDYKQKVSLTTIINRVKANGFYLSKPKRKAHEKEVRTNYTGEIIQHDSYHHKFSPYSDSKWYLITSLDYFSRFILYAILVERETTWEYILALEYVLLKYGFPLAYYVDNYSIFRFVQDRDYYWRNHYKLTDEVVPQWKQVLNDCKVKVIYASSPQAKGKIERPYRWIQDRMVNSYRRVSINNLVPVKTGIIIKSTYCTTTRENTTSFYFLSIFLTTSLNFTLIFKNIFHYLFYSDKYKWPLKLLPLRNELYRKP